MPSKKTCIHTVTCIDLIEKQISPGILNLEHGWMPKITKNEASGAKEILKPIAFGPSIVAELCSNFAHHGVAVWARHHYYHRRGNRPQKVGTIGYAPAIGT
jgi:hypothetical protein